jgi:hypothetical protein
MINYTVMVKMETPRCVIFNERLYMILTFPKICQRVVTALFAFDPSIVFIFRLSLSHLPKLGTSFSFLFPATYPPTSYLSRIHRLRALDEGLRAFKFIVITSFLIFYYLTRPVSKHFH